MDSGVTIVHRHPLSQGAKTNQGKATMGRLTTHVLDTSAGCPSEGVQVELFDTEPARNLLAEGRTNRDGRLDSALLEGEAFVGGEYELVFHAGDYFKTQADGEATPNFLDRVVIRFHVSDPEQHYHVPLLLSPYSYTTYRGS
jgi:5-hydroxyisourate hydrolase